MSNSLRRVSFYLVLVIAWMVLLASRRTAATELHPAIIRSLANEAAFDGYEWSFVMREGKAASEEQAQRGELSEIQLLIAGHWGRDGEREWLVANPREPSGEAQFLMGNLLSNNLYATATDGNFQFKAGMLSVTIESRDNPVREVFSGSPWCSLGFLGSKRLINNGAEHFAFVLQHPQYGGDVAVTEDATQASFELEIQGQYQKVTLAKEHGYLPVRYLVGELQNGVQSFAFESVIREHRTLDNGCVFPTSVVACYQPSETHPYFRVFTFEATDFRVLQPDEDPLLFTAPEPMQLHDNNDATKRVSGVGAGEKIRLSDLEKLAKRIERANAPRVEVKDAAEGSRVLFLALALLVLAVPATWLWYSRRS